MKKVLVTICDKQVNLPSDLLGRPTTSTSWVAKADFHLDSDNFVITITKKVFHFAPLVFRDCEAEARQGFFGKKDHEVKRIQGGSISHHIPAKKFISVNPVLKGEFEFTVQKSESAGLEKVVLTLDVSQFPKDFNKIMQIRSMLVG